MSFSHPYDIIFNKLQATRIHSLSNISPFYGKSIPTDVSKSLEMESIVFKKRLIFDFLIWCNTVTIIVCFSLVAQIKGQTWRATEMMNCIAEKSIFRWFEQIQSTNPIELEKSNNYNKRSKFGRKKTYYSILGCYTILKQ